MTHSRTIRILVLCIVEDELHPGTIIKSLVFESIVQICLAVHHPEVLSHHCRVELTAKDYLQSVGLFVEAFDLSVRVCVVGEVMTLVTAVWVCFIITWYKYMHTRTLTYMYMYAKCVQNVGTINNQGMSIQYS